MQAINYHLSFIDIFYSSFSDDHGFTPLHWACREGQLVVFEMLMARGGRASARNDGGDTALHLACAHGNKDIVHKVNKF